MLTDTPWTVRFFLIAVFVFLALLCIAPFGALWKSVPWRPPPLPHRAWLFAFGCTTIAGMLGMAAMLIHGALALVGLA